MYEPNIRSAPSALPLDRTLKVQGHAEIAAAPDRATLTLGVQSQDKDAQAALASNTTRMLAVINAVRAHGVPEEHVQSSNLSLQYHPENKAYIAMHQLSVHVSEMDRIGAVLDAAVAVGANSSWGISFCLEDPSQATAQALRDAVANAREQASTIASALGVNLIGVISATQMSHGGGMSMAAAPVRRMASVAHTPVQSGELVITADVEVVFALE